MKTPQVPDKLHRPHESKARNLNRRGKTTRTAVTAAEVDFCANFVLTGNVKQASLQAGYSAWWDYELLKMPRIQPILREFERRKQDEAWDAAKDRIILTRELLDELFIQRIVNMKTHPKVGDLPIVKMFETGYKRTGDIQPTRISAEAKAGATSRLAQLYAKRLYLPDWRKEAIEKIQSAERQEQKPEITTTSDTR
jgi:phage terminase small subunit